MYNPPRPTSTQGRLGPRTFPLVADGEAGRRRPWSRRTVIWVGTLRTVTVVDPALAWLGVLLPGCLCRSAVAPAMVGRGGHPKRPFDTGRWSFVSKVACVREEFRQGKHAGRGVPALPWSASTRCGCAASVCVSTRHSAGGGFTRPSGGGFLVGSALHVCRPPGSPEWSPPPLPHAAGAVLAVSGPLVWCLVLSGEDSRLCLCVQSPSDSGICFESRVK